MLTKLRQIIDSKRLQDIIANPYYVTNTPDYPFSSESHWKSLIVNKRKPYTYRIFTYFDDIRICLHRFDACSTDESFNHPHPWPGAFHILKGGYRMDLGQSFNSFDCPPVMTPLHFTTGSSYSIEHPYTWHKITPYEETYTIMVNGPEWPDNVKHSACRTTKGKDLDSLSVVEMEDQLKVFKELLYD